jgi:hypothetical protein
MGGLIADCCAQACHTLISVVWGLRMAVFCVGMHHQLRTRTFLDRLNDMYVQVLLVIRAAGWRRVGLDVLICVGDCSKQ